MTWHEVMRVRLPWPLQAVTSLLYIWALYLVWKLVWLVCMIENGDPVGAGFMAFVVLVFAATLWGIRSTDGAL